MVTGATAVIPRSARRVMTSASPSTNLRSDSVSKPTRTRLLFEPGGPHTLVHSNLDSANPVPSHITVEVSEAVATSLGEHIPENRTAGPFSQLDGSSWAKAIRGPFAMSQVTKPKRTWKRPARGCVEHPYRHLDAKEM